MVQLILNLKSKEQTGRGMHYLINKYSTDLDKIYVRKNGQLVKMSSLTLPEYFNIVRSIPYRKDKKPIEVVSRPKHIFKHRELGMDCKKKAVLIASYLRKNRMPYRLASSSKKKNKRIHHVFPQAFLNGGWVNVDATYPHYNLYAPKTVTKFEVLNES